MDEMKLEEITNKLCFRCGGIVNPGIYFKTNSDTLGVCIVCADKLCKTNWKHFPKRVQEAIERVQTTGKSETILVE